MFFCNSLKGFHLEPVMKLSVWSYIESLWIPPVGQTRETFMIVYHMSDGILLSGKLNSLQK